MFTKAYLNEDGKTVTLKSTCHIKECMALGWFPESKLFPEIERTDWDEINTYTMKYYPKVNSLKSTLRPRQWRLYQALRVLLSDFVIPQNMYDLSDQWHRAFDKLPSEFRNEKEALHGALDSCGNCGSKIHFEISPRNVATDKGMLVLLDCFFSHDQADEIKTSQRQKHRF